MSLGSLRWGVSYSALLLALAVGAPEPAVAAPETVLYSFTGGPDGAYPLSELLVKKSGALIGTTSQGGDLSGCGGKGCGVVFELTPPTPGNNAWNERVLYRFAGGADGATPLAGVLMDKTGALYGTTSAGGGGPCYMYKAHHHTFSSSSGSTYWKKGVRIGCGTIFELTPPSIGHSVWTEAVLLAFQGKNGRSPNGVPLMDKTGSLYGVTSEGGEGPCGYFQTFSAGSDTSARLQIPTGCGTVFELTPPADGRNAWTLNTLYRFKGDRDGGSPDDGAFPDGGVIFAADGSLFGTTRGIGSGGIRAYFSSYQGGTVFKLTPPPLDRTVWSHTIIYAFTGVFDPQQPPGGLFQERSGALLGTTTLGGSGLYHGTVFELSPPSTGDGRWTATTLHAFAGGSDGILPAAGLIRDATTAAFYGVTEYGGNGLKLGGGTVFSLKPPIAGTTNWTETVLHIFGGSSDGRQPVARLATDQAGNLYGTTSAGGGHRYGTVFKVAP